MILQVLNYIRQEKLVSIDHLSRIFQIDRYAIEPMLSRLVDKNLIQAHAPTKACASACRGCFESQAVYYTEV